MSPFSQDRASLYSAPSTTHLPVSFTEFLLRISERLLSVQRTLWSENTTTIPQQQIASSGSLCTWRCPTDFLLRSVATHDSKAVLCFRPLTSRANRLFRSDAHIMSSRLFWIFTALELLCSDTSSPFALSRPIEAPKILYLSFFFVVFFFVFFVVFFSFLLSSLSSHAVCCPSIQSVQQPSGKFRRISPPPAPCGGDAPSGSLPSSTASDLGAPFSNSCVLQPVWKLDCEGHFSHSCLGVFLRFFGVRIFAFLFRD